MNTIYLIRHGRTEANERHLYCGSTDLPLSQTGAAELAEKRYVVGDARFVTSGMLRTEQTLELLFGAVAHDADLRFREVDFGDFEMRSYEELKENDDYQRWLTGDNEANVPPNGESGVMMTQRVISGFQDLAAGEGVRVLITHGGVIAAIMAHLFPQEGKHRYGWQPKPGCGYRLEQEDNGWHYRPME